MARRSEQGNILGFVLVGALLLGLLAGGMYVVKQYGASTNTEVADEGTQSSDDSKEQATQKPTKDTSGDDKLKAALDAQSSDAQKSESGTPAAGAQSSEGSASHHDDKKSEEVAVLPETGPGAFASPLVGVGLLVAASVSYARSRRLI